MDTDSSIPDAANLSGHPAMQILCVTSMLSCRILPLLNALYFMGMMGLISALVAQSLSLLGAARLKLATLARPGARQ